MACLKHESQNMILLLEQELIRNSAETPSC